MPTKPGLVGDLIFGWTRLHGLAVGRESRAYRFGQGDLEHLVHRVHYVQLERIEDGLGGSGSDTETTTYKDLR